MTETVDTILGALGVVGQVAVVALLGAGVAALASPRVRRSLLGSWETLRAQALWAAWGVAAIATAGSLYFSEIADYVPCQLCWYQRIAMYPLVVTLLVGALLRDRRAALYSAIFPVVGAAIAIRHVYVEQNPEADACRMGVPCSTKWIEEFGYVTIPVLALTAFVLIGLLLGVVGLTGRRAGRGDGA